MTLNPVQAFLQNAENLYMRHISIDCVVFGFHAGELKVLLLKMKWRDELALPGGFVKYDERIEEAASRILKERTGVENVFLREFGVFSDPGRSNLSESKKVLQGAGVTLKKDSWFAHRFISIGFFALVEFSLVDPKPDELSEDCSWHNLNEVGNLILDHNEILNTALQALRQQINHMPIGYNLLPDKFTMPELIALYEAILGKTLDRRNFQRKILSYGILRRLNEKRTGVAHKAPYLYRFDIKKYQKALQLGLQGGW